MAEKARKFRLREYKGVKGVFIISPDLCKGCGLCLERCPHQVIDWSEDLGIYGTPMAIPAVWMIVLPVASPVGMPRCSHPHREEEKTCQKRGYMR